MNNNQNEVHVNVQKAGKTGLFTNYIFKAIPLAFDESLSYYEALCGLRNYLKNTVIPVLNNNADAIVTLQNNINEFETNINQEMANFKTSTNESIAIFEQTVNQTVEQLESYMNNYFANLDVQDEINNKLDAMVASGQLESIIAVYLNSIAILGYNNVNSMKSSINLINGSYARTLGYYSINDGGGALYKIRTKAQNETPDEMFVLSMTNPLLVAELIIENNTLNIKQMGARSQAIDGTKYDIKNYIDAYISYLDTQKSKVKLYIPSGIWYTSPISITREEGFYIYGDESFDLYLNTGTAITTLNENQTHILNIGDASHSVYSLVLKNIFFSSADFIYNQEHNCFTYDENNIKNVENRLLYLYNCYFSKTDNLYFGYVKGECIAFRNVWENEHRNINFRNISNYEGCTMHFLETDNSVAQYPNISACTFDNLMFESIHGDCIKFDVRSGMINSIFNNVYFEDYALTFDGATNTSFTPEIVASFDEDTAIHESIFNMEGTAEFVLNNLCINNIGFRYSELNDNIYVFDTIFKITRDYVELNIGIDNLNITGMSKNCRILKQDSVYVNNGIDNSFNVKNVLLNESSYDLYYDINGYKNIYSSNNIKSKRKGYMKFDPTLLPCYEIAYYQANDTKGNLYYDSDTINPLNLAVKMYNNTSVTTPTGNLVITGDTLVIRAKVDNEDVADLTILTKDGQKIKQVNITGDGSYHYYTFSDMLQTFSVGDVVDIRLSSAHSSANVYLDVYKQ